MSAGGERLIEREAEIARIYEALDRAAAGEGAVVALRGTAGIGKTSLLRKAMAAGKERGMTVLSARGNELEQEFPFGVVRQLLEKRVLTADEAVRERLLAGAARLAAPALGIEASEESQTEPSFGLLHGLYWLVANLCLEGPALLAVDDTHWADSASLRFLIYLTRRLEDLPLLAVFARRTGEPATDQRMMTLLAGAPEVPVIVPRPLTVEGAAQLLEAELGEPVEAEVVARCHADTAGNPFLLREVARQIRLEGLGRIVAAAVTSGLQAPDSVSRSILIRLGRLGPEVIALADAVVILGDGCSVAEAAELAGLEVFAADDAVAAMVRAELLASDTALRFVHPLVRSSIEAEMTPTQRAAWHGRAGGMLIERGAEEDRVIAQLLNSAPARDPLTATRLRAAAHDAMTKGAPAAAVHYLRRAMAEPPPPAQLGELLAELGTAEVLSDQLADALPRLRRARELSANSEALVDRTLRLWLALVSSGAINEGVEMIEQTIDEIGDSNREGTLMLEGEFFTAAMFEPERLADSWLRLERFNDLSGDSPAERRLLSMITVKGIYTVGHPWTVVAEIARRSYAGGLLVTENALDASKWVWGVGGLMVTDQESESEAAVKLALGCARATGSLDGLLMALDMRSLLRLRQGRLADAEADAHLALDRLREADPTPFRDLFTLVMVRWLLPVLIDGGRLEEADRLLSEYRLDGELYAGTQHTKLYRERSMLRLSQGRIDEALNDALTLAEFDTRHGIVDVVEAPYRPVAAIANSRLGNTDAAMAIADEHLRLTREWGLPRDLGIALRTRGLVEPDSDPKVDYLRHALTAAKAAPAPLEIAKCHAELGTALLRSGKRTEGKDHLAHALQGAACCGAAALAKRVHDELKVAGARPRRLMYSGVESLTASERRVANMAADGMTNRQIAQALFVTQKTVETHLSNVYRKLDVTSRSQVSAELAQA